MMPACFLPNGDKKNKSIFCTKYRYIKPLQFSCNVSLESLYEIFQKCLNKFTEINICGFNSRTNEYWLKKINKCESNLHFNISIIKKTKTSSFIIITPILGTDNDINILTTRILNLLKIYDKNISC